LNLTGKVAIVTGGGQGTGKAYCLGFAKEGTRVVVADINEETARQTAEEIRGTGGQALAIKVDVSNWDDVSNMVKRTLEEFGQIDILVNNAGLRGIAPIEDFPEEIWERDINVNLKGVFYCTKAVARHMKERRYGKIINQSSITALRGHEARGSAYATAKAGVLGLSRSMAMELGPSNINVNAVVPSVINTPFIANLPEDRKDINRKKSVFGRLAEPDDLVGIVLFLASDRSSFITAQSILVDGGQRPT
ncbi:MAG: SDR family NAD(P)-dependent oxidoreductase, partial [Planctomycetota bacterium]